MRKFSMVVVCIALFAGSGCKGGVSLIDKVVFKPSENLEVVRISLVFTPAVQADFGGGFQLKDYGYLFLNPWTPTQPFEAGFDLNTAIFNDQDYIGLEPTTVLPNGVPIGIPHAVVQINKDGGPIHDAFDIYGYVDVLHTSWLGVAAMFKFMDNRYFPAGLSISQVFLRDKEGNPGVLAAVFGPSLNPDGSLRRNGGIAVFANVRQLIEEHGKDGAIGRTGLAFYPEPAVYLNGPATPEYAGNPRKIRKLERRLIQAFSDFSP
jgi:hypothetical protein